MNFMRSDDPSGAMYGFSESGEVVKAELQAAYTVLQADDFAGLVAAVNDHMTVGWRPLGGPMERFDGFGKCTLHQAMVCDPGISAATDELLSIATALIKR